MKVEMTEEENHGEDRSDKSKLKVTDLTLTNLPNLFIITVCRISQVKAMTETVRFF